MASLVAKNTVILDQGTANIIKKLIKVKESVKRAALMEYLKNAQRLHTVAFFQWRLMWPPAGGGQEQDRASLEELVE